MAASMKTETSASLHPNPLNNSPKTLLTIALGRAQDAVQLDSQKKLDEAIMAYQEAANLLSQVMDTAENTNNRKKLRQIHQTYTNRIFLLSASKNSALNSLGSASIYNKKGASSPENRDEENMHILSKKMSAPLIRTSNQVPSPNPNTNMSDIFQGSVDYFTTQSSNGRKLFRTPESPLAHLLPPTSARLTALSKQASSSSSVNKEFNDSHESYGDAVSERTLPSLERMREAKEAFGHRTIRKQQSSSALQQDSVHSKFYPKLSRVNQSNENDNLRLTRARGYSLSALNQKGCVREKASILPPPPFPPPSLGLNTLLVSNQTNESAASKEKPLSSDPSHKALADSDYVQTAVVERLDFNNTRISRDSKVNVCLDNEEHLEYYLNSESSNTLAHPIPMRCEEPNDSESILPPRSSSLPKKLDVFGVETDATDSLDFSKRSKSPPNLKRLDSDQNLYNELTYEASKSAALKPPTPKFPPLEIIRPSNMKRSEEMELTESDDRVINENMQNHISQAISQTIINRQPPPPPIFTQLARDSPDTNGDSVYQSSTLALKTGNTQIQKAIATVDHFNPRASILAPSFRRKMSLPSGLGSPLTMKSTAQSTNSTLMPKLHSGSPSILSADPSPTGSYFLHPIRRPYKGLTLFDIVLEEPQEGTSLIEQPPQKLELKPFWLMRCFERSMVNGGFISTKMYIPRSLWYQSGARLSAIEAKISACELITAALYNMALSLGYNTPLATTASTVNLKDHDIVVFLRELDSFDTILYSVQNNLAKKLSFIESVKKSQSSFLSLGNRITKSLERITTSRDKIDDVSLYIDVLIKLFQTCQILDLWIKQFHVMSPGELQAKALSRLLRVSDFMNNVICAFVMRDLTVLMAKYMKRCKEWLID